MSQDEVPEQADAVQISQGQILNITLLASEWKSSAGGLSTLNRELAIHLSQTQNVRVSLLVPEGACNNEDKREAYRSFGISILDAKKCVGVEPLLWLSNPPQDHKIDVIVGHGVKLGRQVQLIKRQAQFKNCKWIHVVHTAPEDLSKYKGYSSPISRGEEKHWEEVNLCREADLVVPVGPRLRKAYHSYLQECKKDEDFFELTPGLFDREFVHLPAKQKPKDESDDFTVLLCGRDDEEDFELKGYDIAVEAFADQRLKGKRCFLLFVGSAEGKQDEVRQRLLNCGNAHMDKKQLTVREFAKSREIMKDLLCEVDMVIMPSKSEGFGLVALEALSAGLPILVGRNSGFARAIEDIPLGSYSIVDSENPAKWAKAIQRVRGKHGVILEESRMLKEGYGKKYCWKKQCEELIDTLWKMVYAVADKVEQNPSTGQESVCQPGPKTMQQHIEKGAVTSGRGKEGTPGDELTLPGLKLGCRGKNHDIDHGMNTNEAVKIQRSEQQLPSVSSERFSESCSVHTSKINDEEKALVSDRNKQYLEEMGEALINLLVTAPHLKEEQQRVVYRMLAVQVQTYQEFQDHSTDKEKGLGAMTESIIKTYGLLLKNCQMGSLIITFNCQSIESLEHLWSDYLSGHLDEMAEQYLVTDEMKEKLNLETISMKTTIKHENYFNCRKVLLERSGTSAAQAVGAEDSIKLRPLAISEAVSQTDPTTVQQQFKEGASTSGSKNPKKLGKRGISESTAEHGNMASSRRNPNMAIPLCLPNNYRWNATTGKCSQISEERSSLVIVDEALQKLRTLEGPVCVVSITGRYRGGKSFILSEVFDQPDVFPVGHSLDRETVGIWMWIVPGKFRDSNGQECSIVLLDSEGIDPVRGEGLDDSQIFTLSVLLSSVLIYNSVGLPVREDLADLKCIAKLSQRVKLRSRNEGQPSVAARQDDTEYFHKAFPFFIWLLRDVILSTPTDCKDIKEYFLKWVFQGRKGSNDGSVQKVAESILRFFSGFEAFQLPPPSSDRNVLENITRNKDKLTLAFLSGVQKFKPLLKSVLVAKRSFNDGDIVTGEGLAALVSFYVEAINSPGKILNVQAAWETFVMTKCSEVRQASFHLYKETMTAELSGKLPCDNDVIREKHEMALQKGLALLDKETFGIAATTTEKYLKEMMISCDEALQSWLLENESLTRQACDALLKELKKQHLDPVLERLHGQGGAEVSFDDITQGCEGIKQSFDVRATGAKDVCAAMFYDFYPILMKEMQGNLRILKQLKDFDERKSREIAARAYQQREIKRLEEQHAKLLQEDHERQMEMEKQQTKFNEEKERLQQKMEADAKARQEQTTNMTKASMQKAEQDRRAMMQDNQVMKARLEEMQRRYQESLMTTRTEFNERLLSLQEKKREVSREEFSLTALELVTPIINTVVKEAIRQNKCIVM